MSDEISFLEGRRELPKEQTVDEMKRELADLRKFYAAWEHLHSIPHDPRMRAKAEEAAQLLIEAAKPLRRK